MLHPFSKKVARRRAERAGSFGALPYSHARAAGLLEQICQLKAAYQQVVPGGASCTEGGNHISAGRCVARI